MIFFSYTNSTRACPQENRSSWLLVKFSIEIHGINKGSVTWRFAGRENEWDKEKIMEMIHRREEFCRNRQAWECLSWNASRISSSVKGRAGSNESEEEREKKWLDDPHRRVNHRETIFSGPRISAFYSSALKVNSLNCEKYVKKIFVGQFFGQKKVRKPMNEWKVVRCVPRSLLLWIIWSLSTHRKRKVDSRS